MFQGNNDHLLSHLFSVGQESGWLNWSAWLGVFHLVEWQLKSSLLKAFRTSRSSCEMSHSHGWQVHCWLLAGGPGPYHVGPPVRLFEVPHNVTAGFCQNGWEFTFYDQDLETTHCHFCNDSRLCLLWETGHTVGCECRIARPGRPSWRLANHIKYGNRTM